MSNEVKNSNKFISVVIPVFNEEENLPVLLERLVKILEQYNQYEIVFVNDGSTDSSESIIMEEGDKNKFIKLINLSRNFGHQTAITAGIANASGEAVIVMDADLQDPPEVIPQFVDKWCEGYDTVYAIRTKRKENFFKKTAYFVFYRLLSKISDVNIPLDSGDFSIMDRRIVDLMNQFPEKNCFVRGMRAWLGFKQTGLVYQRDQRFSGKPKYNFLSLLELSYDGIISFSKKPLQVASYFGICLTFLSFIGIIYLFLMKMYWGVAPRGWTSIIVIVIFIGGVQTMMIGIIGEYLARIYDEVKGRPYYLVRSSHNMEEKINNMKTNVK